ncbi:hypothetical protein HHK36_002831 [Tetracentron sinense]|uniref:Uncharacterized protein n=1 Tax=Tetracentron sinense TaxID=13715 RepID=A0A834ZRN0_TETSI|nr:hypothetical protein HHK36_002831 [Tetracentron sinense]
MWRGTGVGDSKLLLIWACKELRGSYTSAVPGLQVYGIYEGLALHEKGKKQKNCYGLCRPTQKGTHVELLLMGQQMIDSKSNEYGLGNTGTGSPTCDKPPPIAVKKIALRDLQNDNRIVVPEPLGNSPLLKERGPITNASKLSGAKRITPEFPPRPPCYQSPSSDGTTGHLMYARRKSESELYKSSTCDNTGSNTSCSQFLQSSQEGQETPRQQTQMNQPKISCFSAYAPIPTASLMTFSSGGPSVPLFPGIPASGLSPVEPNCPTVTSVTLVSVTPQGKHDQHRKERFLQLQTLLKNCDNSNLEDYVQTLRSLSSADLSRHAVELEKRSILLSIEEAKEMLRKKDMKILGISTQKNNPLPSTQQVQPEK